MPEEKRYFFRIQEEVYLTYQQVDAHSLEQQRAEDHFPDNQTLNIITELRQLDQEASVSLNQVTEHHRPTADYLAILNRKIELLSTHFIASQLDLGNITPSRVSISEGGVGFEADRPFYKDCILVLRILFTPHFAGICAYTKVTRCEQRQDKFWIAASFFDLDVKRQQILGRQIMQAQLADRRRHKINEEKK